MYRIKNTADDRSKHLKHRTATKFELEPSLGGHRIRLGTHYDISDEHYARVKPLVDEWVKKGMVEVLELGPMGVFWDPQRLSNARALEPAVKQAMEMYGEGQKQGLMSGGPTLEEWTAAGYQAENYPPQGYAEVFSPALVAHKRAQEEAANTVAPLPGPQEDRPFDPSRDYVIKPTDIDEANAQIRASQESAKAPESVKEDVSAPTPSPQPPSSSKADKGKKLR